MKTIKVTYNDNSYALWDYTSDKLKEIILKLAQSNTLLDVVKIEVY